MTLIQATRAILSDLDAYAFTLRRAGVRSFDVEARAKALRAALRAANDAEQAPPPSAPAKATRGPRKATREASDLTSPVKLGAKGSRRVGAYVATFADGGEVRVCGVVYSDPRDQWAAAAQAADRLRRMRHGSASLRAHKLPSAMVAGMMGVMIRSADWLTWEKAAPLATLATLRCEETGEVFDARPATFGGGDELAAARAWAACKRIPRDPRAISAERAIAEAEAAGDHERAQACRESLARIEAENAYTRDLMEAA